MTVQQTVKYGNFTITEPMWNPTLELFEEWRDEYLESVDLTSLNVMFMGNAAEKFFGTSQLRTIDIDIMFSGDVDCNKKKEVMEKAFELGMKRNLYVDTLFISQDIFENRWWDNNYTVTKITSELEIWTGDRTIIRSLNGDNFIENDCGLFEYTKTTKEDSFSYRKHKKRLDAGHYQDLRYNLKTMEQLTFS